MHYKAKVTQLFITTLYIALNNSIFSNVTKKIHKINVIIIKKLFNDISNSKFEFRFKFLMYHISLLAYLCHKQQLHMPEYQH